MPTRTKRRVDKMSENHYELKKNNTGEYDIFTCYGALIISNIKEEDLAYDFLNILNSNHRELELWMENYNILEEGCKQFKEETERTNKELQRQVGVQQVEIECLSDELAQCKAVIDKQWSEYLEKKDGDM